MCFSSVVCLLVDMISLCHPLSLLLLSGPQHCLLKDIGRVNYVSITDQECLDAFMTLSRIEGIIPALESAHAVAYAMKQAKEMTTDQTILVNLSGRGDKDADFVAELLSL